MRRGLLVGALVLGAAGVMVLAHEETYKGTVIAVEPAKVQVKVFDAKSKKDTPMDFAVTAKTKVLRGDRPVSFVEARIQRDERIAVTVNHDEPGHKALVIRLAALNAGQVQTTRGALDLQVQPVVSPASAPSGEPQLSVSSRGVLLSWIERAGARATLKFAERTATGWSAPRVVASGDDWFVNWADVPSVLRLADGTLAAHWLQKSGPGTYAYDVRLSHSSDDGKTWSPSFMPHHDGTKTEHGFASLFEMPGAGLGLVWLDGRAMAPDAHDAGAMAGGAMAIRSASFDRRWTQASELPVDLRVCECCPTTVAVTSDGPVVAFRNRTEDEIRDIYVSRLDGGRWTEPKPVHDDGWRINACPVNGPMLSARGRDVALAWFTMKAGQGQAFVAFSKDAGRTFTAPIRVDDGGSLGRVDVELLPDGAAMPSWIEYANDKAEFRVRRIESSGARSEAVTIAAISASRPSGYPRLARHGTELVFAWTEITRGVAGVPDGTRRVQTAVARLPGVTPAPPQDDSAVSVVRLPDGGIQAQVAVDSKGGANVVYFKGEPSNGDVFYARLGVDAAWTPSLRVNSQAGSAIATGNVRGAQLAVGRSGRVHIAWNGSGRAAPTAEGGATPMLYTRLNTARTAFEPQRNLVHTAVGLDGGGAVAADAAGRVFVAWHAGGAESKGEGDRRVWVAGSTDDGATFARERPASDISTGACGCCGMDGLIDRRGALYLLYRSARDVVHRDTYLLISKDGAKSFAATNLQEWNIGACPMSTFALVEGPAGVIAAWETGGQVQFARVGAGASPAVVEAPGAARTRKHPAIAVNGRDEVLLVWTEGMGWQRGGALVWQVFDRGGRPTPLSGVVPGVPVWSLVAVYARPDGRFVIVY